MENVPIMVVTADTAVTDHVQAAAAALGRAVAVVSTVPTALAGWASAEVVLVGSDLAGALASEGPRRRERVYLVGPPTAELVTWSMPLGAEVIPLPQGLSWLTAVLARDESAACPLIAIVGGSGGVGASSVAVGLAQAVVSLGRRAALVDLDALGGGIDLLLGAERAPGWRWPRLAGARGEVGDVRSLLPCIEGVTVVSMARDESEGPPAESIQAVLGSLSRHHDLVIVDGGRSPAPAVRQQVQAADLTLVVSGADVRSVAASARVVTTLNAERAGLLVRRTRAGGANPEAVADTVGLEVRGVIPFDRTLVLDAEAGEPPRPRSAWAKSMRVLAGHLLQEVGDEG